MTVIYAPDPYYDIAGALTALVPGLEVQHDLLDAAWAAYQAKNFVPLTATDIPGILAAAPSYQESGAGYVPTTEDSYPAALPAFPASLPRFPDSNPDPVDNWVKYSTDKLGAP